MGRSAGTIGTGCNGPQDRRRAAAGGPEKGRGVAARLVQRPAPKAVAVDVIHFARRAV